MNSFETALITDPTQDPDGLKLLTLLYDTVLVPDDPRRFGAIWALSSESEHLFQRPPPDVLKGLASAWTSVQSLERPFRPLVEQYHLDPTPAQKATIRKAVRDRYPEWEPTSETEWMTHEDVATMHLAWLGYWQRELPHATLVGSAAIEAALSVYEADEAIGLRRDDVHLHVPDVRELPWKDILALRKSDCIQDFRRKLGELRATGSLAELSDRYNEAMADLVHQLRPSFTRTAVLAVISNLPLTIPVNPIGIAMSVHELVRTKRVLREFGWVFFLSDLAARKRALSASDTGPGASGLRS